MFRWGHTYMYVCESENSRTHYKTNRIYALDPGDLGTQAIKLAEAASQRIFNKYSRRRA